MTRAPSLRVRTCYSLARRTEVQYASVLMLNFVSEIGVSMNNAHLYPSIDPEARLHYPEHQVSFITLFRTYFTAVGQPATPKRQSGDGQHVSTTKYTLAQSWRYGCHDAG